METTLSSVIEGSPCTLVVQKKKKGFHCLILSCPLSLTTAFFLFSSRLVAVVFSVGGGEGLGLTGVPVFNVNNNCSSGSTGLMMASLLVQAGYHCTMAVGELPRVCALP